MRKLIPVGLILVLLAAAFLLLNFRAASSHTSAADNFSSARGGAPAPSQKIHVYVWVEEKDRLSTQLRDSVMERLRQSGRMDVEPLPTPKPGPNDYPLLRVWISTPGYSWTPFYAQTDMEVRYGFSTFSSDIPLDKDVLVSIDNRVPYPLHVKGSVKLTDKSFGLISLPGYWDWLSSQAAEKLSADLLSSIK
jgi:hypothetical protein